MPLAWELRRQVRHVAVPVHLLAIHHTKQQNKEYLENSGHIYMPVYAAAYVIKQCCQHSCDMCWTSATHMVHWCSSTPARTSKMCCSCDSESCTHGAAMAIVKLLQVARYQQEDRVAFDAASYP